MKKLDLKYLIYLLTETMSKIPKEIQDMSDDQLRNEIIKHKLSAGPVTDTTRKAYQNRLASVWGKGGAAKSTPTKAPAPRRSPKKQSLAAMSSEEEEEEEVIPPPRPTRHATPPARKSCAFLKIICRIFIVLSLKMHSNKLNASCRRRYLK